MKNQTKTTTPTLTPATHRELTQTNGGILFETVMVYAILGGVAYATYDKLREIEEVKQSSE